jgi:hypothetical protein
MAIKKYFANADNTITNAFRASLQSRGVDANMGAADVLETFSIYGQASSGSTELSRILINFPVDEIIADRASGATPEAGKAKFYLNLYNAATNQTVPRHLYLSVRAISREWQEGTGLDMAEYKDVVAQGDIGSTWISASSTSAWTNMGGDYHAAPVYSEYFDTGVENLSVDVTSLVEEWIAGTKDKFGVGIHLSASQEAYYSGSAGADSANGQLNNLSGSKTSYYTKEFFARGSEFFFKRPTISVKWDSTKKDDRGQVYTESNLLSAADNKNTLYLYNSHNGRLKDIPVVGTGADALTVKIYNAAAGGSQITATTPAVITAGRVSKGIYTASFAIDSTASIGYDRWFNPGLTQVYHTGNFYIRDRQASTYSSYPNYVTSLTNLRSTYYSHETARFRFYVRQKDWSPTIYTVATTETDTLIIESSSYQVHRLIDNTVIIPFDTGSDKSTEMSYDVSGNYFDLSMDLFEPGYSYGLKVSYYDESVLGYVEQPSVWKFRVEKLESQ